MSASKTVFDFAPLLTPGLPPPALRWNGFPKYNFIGGHNDAEHVPLEALVKAANDVLTRVGEEFHGSPGEFMLAAFSALPVWLAALGVFTAWWFFLKNPALADAAERRFKWLYTILVNKYGFDWFYENVVAAGARVLGGGLWRFGDQIVIDDGLVNGSARTVGWLGSVMRYAQSGYLYHYAFAMILGLASLLMWLLWRT